MPKTPSSRHLLAFAILGLVWGSSFLWIKIGIAEMPPLPFVALRLFIALIGLFAFTIYKGQSLAVTPKAFAACAVVGVLNCALPFTLITWAEQSVPSSLASVLNGMQPLWTLIIAHFALRDEKITLPKLAGLVIGFAGVIVLVGDVGSIRSGSVAGALAILGASVSYALSSIVARRYLRAVSPLVQTVLLVFIADILLMTIWFASDTAIALPTQPLTWMALTWLGLLGTCCAYVLYFYLIREWGATKASLVTYVFPAVGVVLGTIFLDETLSLRFLMGSVCIFTGLVIANTRFRRQLVPTQNFSASET